MTVDYYSITESFAVEEKVFVRFSRFGVFQKDNFYWNNNMSDLPDKFLDGKQYTEIEQAEYDAELDEAINTIKGI